ncbi:MAG TPA: hypothetical protein VE978_16880 [Chitinophagales bacterium]|nr:hypothetical protein [Chitinophagales bacterium]
MKFFCFLLGPILLFIGCHSSSSSSFQTKKYTNTLPLIGGGCDGCELMYAGMPDNIGWIDTLPDWNEAGEKMEVSGTVYQLDEKTPAANVILYFYHTDSKGYYSPADSQTIARRNGHIRGWVKTNAQGAYKIYTNKPAHYPGTNIPAHIHVVVKEPGKNEYYIDEYEFEGDSLLTEQQELRMEKRGGKGVVKLTKDVSGILDCHRDIMLGLNIPNYR